MLYKKKATREERVFMSTSPFVFLSQATYEALRKPDSVVFKLFSLLKVVVVY